MTKGYKAATIAGGIISIIFSAMTILWIIVFFVTGFYMLAIEIVFSLLGGILYAPALFTTMLLLIPLALSIVCIIFAGINFGGKKTIKILSLAFSAGIVVDLLLLWIGIQMAPTQHWQFFGGHLWIFLTLISGLILLIGGGLQFLSSFLEQI